MHPNTLFPLLTFIITMLFGNITTSYSDSNNKTYSNCTTTFSCGSVENLTYPFTGGDRPSHCGLPDFKLSCRDNYPELTIASLTYRVIEVNQSQNALTIARLDLWNNTCPKQFVNSTPDLPIFDYSMDNEALYLFYDCSPFSIKPYHQFSCNVPGGNYSDSYFSIGPILRDPAMVVLTCSITLFIPIIKTSAAKLNSNITSLGESLTEGFIVTYKLPYVSECLTCEGTGGQCGYDSDSLKFACYCGNLLCPISTGNSSINGPLIIGLVITGTAILAFFVFLILFVRQRRKKVISEYISKGITTPSSSHGVSTPSKSLSQTTPSYPSTVSTDLEKGSMYFGVQVFTYNELEEATDNFDSSKELGDGGFGVVYKGKLNDGRVVAVKRLYENNFKCVEQFINEIEILARLRHKNLVTLFGCTSRKSRGLLLVYEYIPNGTVADHLHGNKAKLNLLTWPIRLNIAIETASALSYLHKQDIIHRDVKTTNILLDNNFQVKVADFGLIRLFPTDVTHVSTAPQGTPGYVDPEYYQCYKLTDKSDVYSFGVVLIELISSLQAVDTNRHRHDINLSNMAVNKIQNQLLHELVDPSLGFEKNEEVKKKIVLVAELAFRCLQQDRDMRPCMEEVLESLRMIQNEEISKVKQEAVDLNASSDNVGLLKNMATPVSSESVASFNWANGSTSSDNVGLLKNMATPVSSESVASFNWANGSTASSSI